MGLKNAIYTDDTGRKHSVLLPEGVPEEEAEKGIPLGPPDLTELGLPEEIGVRLHNELFYRGIITGNDALRNRPSIMSAIQSCLKLSVDNVLGIYLGKDYKNYGREKPAEGVPNPSVSHRRSR
jgi:hypothetical protein